MIKVENGKCVFGDVQKIKILDKGDIIICHHNDLDGRTAGHVMAHALMHTYNDRVRLYECDYNKRAIDAQHIDFANAAAVFVLDLSVDTGIMKEIATITSQYNIPIVWLDHHQSTLTHIEEFCKAFSDEIDKNIVTGVIDNGRCGARLTYDYFKKEFLDSYYIEDEPALQLNVEKFIMYVDDYDRWVKSYEESEYLNTYMYSSSMMYPLSPIYDKLIMYPEALTEAISYGKEFSEVAKQKNDITYRAFSYEATVDGHSAIIITGFGNSTNFGDHLDDYDLAIVLHRKFGMWEFSMFTSKEGINCAEICERLYNGGGHVKAAGGRSIKRPF